MIDWETSMDFEARAADLETTVQTTAHQATTTVDLETTTEDVETMVQRTAHQ